jgi:hypothetical protein
MFNQCKFSFFFYIKNQKKNYFLFRMKCNEAPEEPPTVSEERLLQLSCFINQGKFH